MKWGIWICVMALSLQAVESLKLGLIPWNTPQQMLKDYEPTRKLLESELKVPVSVRVSKNYNEILSRFESGAINMMLLNGNLFARTYDDGKSFRYLATVKTDINGEAVDHYNSLIITHKDSGIRTMKILREKYFHLRIKARGPGM